MIVRATTIDFPFVHPCKLKGPENARVRITKYIYCDEFLICQKRFARANGGLPPAKNAVENRNYVTSAFLL